MDYVISWIEGLPDFWLRIIALAALCIGVYQMFMGIRANRRLKKMEEQSRIRHEATQQFLFQKFGTKIEIKAEGSFEAPKADVTVKATKRSKNRFKLLALFAKLKKNSRRLWRLPGWWRNG